MEINVDTPLFEHPELQQLAELRVAQEGLTKDLADPNLKIPAIREMYETALQQNNAEQDMLARQDSIQQLAASMALESMQGIEQLEKLRGIAPDAVIDEQAHVLGDRLREAKGFFETYGAHGVDSETFLGFQAVKGLESDDPVKAAVQAAPSVPAEPATPKTPAKSTKSTPAKAAASTADKTPATPEIDIKKQTITMTVEDDGVKIGKKEGYFKKFATEQRRDSDNTYKEERKRALVALVAAGRDLNPIELWDSMYDDGRPYSLHVMAPVRKWLKSITYRKQPVFVHNGNRGPSSAYGVNPKFDIDLKLAKPSTTPSEEAKAEALRVTELDDELLFAEIRKDEEQFNGVHESSFYITALQLLQFEDVLKELGLPTVSATTVKRLKVHAPDLSSIVGDSRRIEAFRKTAHEEISSLFDSDEGLEKLMDMHDALPEDSPEWKFIDCMIDQLQDDDDRILIGKLMRAHKIRSFTADRSGAAADSAYEIIGHDGIKIWPRPVRSVSSPSKSVAGNGDLTSHDRLESMTEELEARIESDSEEQAVTEPVVLEADTTVDLSAANSATKPAKTSEKTPKQAQKMKEVEQSVKEIIDTFGSALSIEGSYTLGTLSRFFPRISRQFETAAHHGSSYLSARDKGGLRELKVKDVIEAVLHSDKNLQNTMSVRTWKADIEKIIDEAIAAAVAPAK